MSLLNLAWRVIAAVTLVVTGPHVMGQGRNLPNGPAYHPFAEPLEFDPDWQFFAPVDVESMMEQTPRNRANEGWFASYDRTYLWVSRPETEQSRGTGDFGYGNRFDLGFMTSERSGWLVNFRNIGGPNVYDTIYQERINRVNTDDVNDPIGTPVQPFIDSNDEQLGTRVYILSDSLNVFGLTNFELNKTWRREPYRFGGVIEPMIGFKYATLNDLAMNQVYNRSINQITEPGATTTETQLETLISHETSIKNRMVGGQLGARYFTHYRRWTLSSEFRAFAMTNIQSMRYAQNTFTTEYSGGPAINVDVVATDYTTGTGFVHDTNTEFVFGFEARAEAAYQVTKAFSIRGGVDVLDFADGIWRAANPGFGNNQLHDQDVQLAGFTLGLEINR
ncbi:MAG: BBP7 family outer membrane beta-barrel protein [Planctomycetales bacterium]|nr:BBP7 family outer membrane beta-barrel protein [Planctomycetales bacterium]